MAGAIVSLVLQTLRDPLVQEATLLSGVADRVEEVRVELKRMLCFLKDADSKQCKDESIRNWLREIRSLAYRIEDIVETFAIEVAARKSSGKRGIKKFIKRSAGIFGEIRSLHKLGTEIEKVKSSITDITTSLSRYDVKSIREEKVGSSNDDQQFQQWSRQTYGHETQEYFVGMEEDITKLVSLVNDDNSDHRIVSIWGMGGLGKTTLARKVYKHRDVQRRFERFAWTCVTQEAHINGILQDLLTQLLPERENDVTVMEGRELVRQLHQVQIERKCLVILDDIWKEEDWKSILAAFPVAEGDSKVLLTTRDRKVAEIGYPYVLKCLNEMEGWELLRRIAFSSRGTGFQISPDFEDLGMKMLSKYGGLPLAISVLGGILKDKETLADWMNVNTCIGSYLSKIEDDGEADGGSIARVLSLSYNELPYHLKICFLYLGIFKEDEEIIPDDLYQLWMAENLVLPQHRRTGETLMEVAGRYLHELGRRSMVQLKWSKYSLTKRIDSCCLHDMMRDLCLEKGREEEFVTVMDSQEVNQPLLDSSSLSDSATYRLVIHMEEEVNAATRILSVQDNSRQIRSLFCLNRFQFWDVWPQDIVVKNFKMLRTLKFKGFNFGAKTLPLELRNLIHLRILSLDECKLDELPSSVAELPLLQTLDLRVWNKIIIPDILWKMKRLKHLYLGWEHRTKGGKLRLQGLSELEILWGIDDKMDEIGDLPELENLRILSARVDDNDNLHALFSYLNKNGQKVQEIKLTIGGGCEFITSGEEGYDLLEMVFMCGRIHRLEFNAKLVEFPNYEPHFSQGLAELYLDGNNMEEDPMETLGQLPHLRSLYLWGNSFMGEYMICHELSFPQLRILSFWGLEKLKYWRVEEGCMPNLSNLVIAGCTSMAMIPYGLQFATGLKELWIENMPSEFCNGVRVVDGQEGADYYKIQHVPSIRVIKLRPL